MAGDPMRLADASPFPFPALAARAGAAPLGGPRETGLVMLMACRLVADAAGTTPQDRDARRDRAQAARQWLGTLALPLPVRAAAARAIDATVDPSPDALGAGLLQLLAACGPHLDEPALADVRRLVTHVTA
ncbi:MAG: hypothetical protein MUF53_06215 [Gemmatimonadaceae bacterium]|jgi:hypothetical protein|nr:hypothetical protein [Gemmatimonadaceae bacterium]